MIIEKLLSKWLDVKMDTIFEHKKYNHDIASATSAYGLNVEASSYALDNKEKLNKLETKWDNMFGSFLDSIEKLEYHNKLSLLKVVDNFGKKFYNDLNREFPKRNFIKV